MNQKFEEELTRVCDELLAGIEDGTIELDEQFIEEVRSIISTLDWRSKVTTTGVQLGKLVREVAQARVLMGTSINDHTGLDDTLGMFYLTMVHTCYKHPEWMRAVVEESEEYSEQMKSASIDSLMHMWPIAPRYSEIGG